MEEWAFLSYCICRKMKVSRQTISSIRSMCHLCAYMYKQHHIVLRIKIPVKVALLSRTIRGCYFYYSIYHASENFF